MKIETGRAVIFVMVLGAIGAVMQNAIKYNAPRPVTIAIMPVAQVSSIPKPPPVVVPIVSISKIWPDGAIPTKIVHVPDPQEPAKGLLEITLHQGDDLELDFDPLWILHSNYTPPFPAAEVAIDGGNGFETLQEFDRSRENSGANAWWSKSRILRMRLVAGHGDVTYEFTIEKMQPEKPLPVITPQVFGDLSVSFEGMRVLPDRNVIVYLMFHNNSSANTMAVALHDEPCTFFPCELASSLVCSDGTPYIIYTSELTGINGIRTKPSLLTPIEPGQELKTSLKFEPRGVVSDTITSVRLQAEIVVNPTFQTGEYSNYRETGRDFLPPDCTVVNMMFDIPLRPSH